MDDSTSSNSISDEEDPVVTEVQMETTAQSELVYNMTNKPVYNHDFDVWHVAKGLEKKLGPLAKKHPVIFPWIKGIIKHLYWSAVSTPSAIPHELKKSILCAKWMSLLNHIVNVHEHDNEHFPHPDTYVPTYKKWLDKDSIAYNQLRKMLLNTRLLKDVGMLSTDYQTSSIEAYHSLLLNFAQKLRAFGYSGMLCRHYLAALHYNENSDRDLIEEEPGVPKLVATFPKKKHKESAFSIRTTKESSSHSYALKLFQLSLESKANCMKRKREFDKFKCPPFLNADFNKPSNEELHAKYTRRFKS